MEKVEDERRGYSRFILTIGLGLSLGLSLTLAFCFALDAAWVAAAWGG